ncbi:MAG: GNAT family N-acetyltransferase [Lachnospirales bacterium]
MIDYKYIRLHENEELQDKAAQWFHEKWNVPKSEYLKSMRESALKTIPKWYIVLHKDEIIGGLGVIENDFHNRKDLTPNICAVYVEKEYRCMGLGGELLEYVCKEMAALGFKNIYLLTDHTSYYEKYGWEFTCMVESDGEDYMGRMYEYVL